jgi:hypothetical protein
VVAHEITHSTTDRKIREAFNPQLMIKTPGAERVPQSLTEALSGREMRFKGKNGKPLKLPHTISGYERFYRSDEVEAHLRELAQAKKDGLDLENTLTEINSFIDTQEVQINALLKKKSEELSIITEEAENELMAGPKDSIE